ncbi:MAG: VanW family protein [Clostridia bacterium]
MSRKRKKKNKNNKVGENNSKNINTKQNETVQKVDLTEEVKLQEKEQLELEKEMKEKELCDKEEKKDLLDEIIEKHEEVEKPKESNIVYYDDKEKQKKRNKVIAFTCISFVLSLIVLFCIIVCINKTNTNVYKNIFVFDKDLSKMSSQQVIEVLKNKSESIKSERKIDVYQDNESIYSIRGQDIGLEIDVEDTAKKIMEYGRSDNILKDNIKILRALFKPVTIEPTYKYNDAKVEDIVKNIELTLKERFVDDSYSLDEKNHKIVIVKGKNGNTLDYNIEKEHIIHALEQDLSKSTIDIIEKKPTSLDVEKVHQEIKKDAKDAYIDRNSNPAKFVSEQIGFDFSITDLENTLNLPENQVEGKSIDFNLKVIEPKVKLTDITYTLYKDKLAGYTTYFDSPQGPRGNNLNIALRYLNGKIIMPGETFSFNKAIGDTTAAKGYLEAATFKGGTVVMEMGGGICQTTSTLYDVALMANLEIVERHPHRTTRSLCSTK